MSFQCCQGKYKVRSVCTYGIDSVNNKSKISESRWRVGQQNWAEILRSRDLVNLRWIGFFCLWGCLVLCLKQVWRKNGKTLSLFISKVIWDTCEWPIEMRRMRIKDKIPISKVMNHHSLKFWNYLCVNSWFFQGLENLFKGNKYEKEWSWVPEWLKSSQILKQCSPKCIQAELLVVNIFSQNWEWKSAIWFFEASTWELTCRLYY